MTEQLQTSQQAHRPHIFEIDFIRAITVFSVVAVHVLSTTSFLVKGPISSVQLFNFIIHLLHYNREMFVFVTGLVLTYVYFSRHFSAKQFWIKRALLVLVPYVLWTVIYVRINYLSADFFSFIKLSGLNILTGNASYQLYYILLALQFYAIFPLFLILFKKIYRHPWIILSISFLIQVVGMYIDFRFLQSNILHITSCEQALIQYQDRYFITYQFFFLLGAYAAVYMQQVYFFLKKYGTYLFIVLVITLLSYYLYFYRELHILKEQMWYTTSVLQPSVVIYSTVIIIFFSWISIVWAKNKKAFGMIKTISNVSFGIYFVHILFMNFTIKYLLPYMPSAVPGVLKIGLVVLFTFTASAVFCYGLLKVPMLNWTIGKGSKNHEI